jgi:two-component system, OmpR family, sensor histidine kinase KdpD
LIPRSFRLLVSFGSVAIVTFVAYRVFPVNATTVGFAYLLLVLIIASTWGFLEASLSSALATIVFNFFFLPPIGTFTIADPQNWVALISFLATSLIASRLSTKAGRRALEAIERQQAIEGLYTFSRAILLTDSREPVAKQLVQKLADIFRFRAAVLYDRRTDELYRAGPSDFDGMDSQVRDAAQQGTLFSTPSEDQVITAVRLGSDPIASLALQGARMPNGVLQGIVNLVAIGIERAKSEEIAHQMEAARRSEQLRTALIDAMAHEFKTPLTSIKAATTALLSNLEGAVEHRTELLTVADEEASRLRNLIDDTIEAARLDTEDIMLHLELSDVANTVKEVINGMDSETQDREIVIFMQPQVPGIRMDRRLVKLAFKQIIENALKYSLPDTPITVRILDQGRSVTVEVTNLGSGIPAAEQSQIFQRFYRSPSVKKQVPGSGLGLSIAQNVMRAHQGDLTLMSTAGETTFRLSFPIEVTE